MTPEGPVAAGDLKALFDAVALMLTIVVRTILAIFACAWWYLASNTRATRLPDFVFFRAYRAGGVGDPAPDDRVPRRNDLDQFA